MKNSFTVELPKYRYYHFEKSNILNELKSANKIYEDQFDKI